MKSEKRVNLFFGVRSISPAQSPRKAVMCDTFVLFGGYNQLRDGSVTDGGIICTMNGE